MNIAFLNSIENEIYGGMEEWIRLAAVGLAARNHNVTLIGRKDSYFLSRAGEPHKELNKFPIDISGDFNPSTITTIKNYLTENKIDILTVNFNKDIRLGGLAARLQGRTKIIWSVGLNITKDAFIHKFLTPKLIDKVITPSQSLKDEITALGYIEKEITEVIPISIDDVYQNMNKQSARETLIERYNLPCDAIISVTSGRFVEQKAHEYLIDAAPEIVKEFPNIRFLFLGDGPRQELLQQMIAKHNLSDNFIFCGMLDNIDTELLGADLMIHPSRVEPFGIAILEGMRASLPIVASRVGGIPEVVQDGYNATLVEACNHEAISKAVIALLKNKEQFKSFATNSRSRFKEHFQMHTMIDKIESCYHSVAHQSSQEKI